VREDLEGTAATFENLYSFQPPPDSFCLPEGLPTNTKVKDDIPSTDEILLHAKRLKNGKAPGLTGMRSEDIKRWATTYEASPAEEKENLPFSKLVKLVQTVFRTGVLPEAMCVSVLVLIPKANTKEYRGIGLLETIWKLVTSIIDGRLKAAVEFQPEIHGFCAERGTGTAILCDKLLKQSAMVKGESLKQVYLDLSKAYDNLDRSQSIKILRAYGVGENVLRVLENFWRHQHVVPRAAGYYGRCFRAHRGVTQGDIVSPMIFNIVVDCIVRIWKTRVPPNLVHLIFYADDGMAASLDGEALQKTVDELKLFFASVGLRMNSLKTKAMITDPGHIRTGVSTPAYLTRLTGEGASFHQQQSLRVKCHCCNREMRRTSLPRHLITAHKIYTQPPQQLSARLFGGEGQEYTVSIPKGRREKCPCPVPDCPGRATNGFDMRKHFLSRHPLDTVIIEEEGLLPQCSLCGMFIKGVCIDTHGETLLCQNAQRQKARREAAERASMARKLVFAVGEDELERVDQFLYLGRWVTSNDQDTLTVHANIRKAQQRWQGLARVLVREGAKTKVISRFYESVILSVLLYGSETWVMTDQHYRALNTFHKVAARKIAQLPIRYDGEKEEWIYPPLQKVFEKTGLSPLYDYIHKRREYILDFAKNHPLYQELTTAARSNNRTLWVTDSSLEKFVLKHALNDVFDGTMEWEDGE
jgi:Reverse transcriptase (RNA-dependent DNA polymerase)